jgi:hypothetical protein
MEQPKPARCKVPASLRCDHEIRLPNCFPVGQFNTCISDRIGYIGRHCMLSSDGNRAKDGSKYPTRDIILPRGLAVVVRNKYKAIPRKSHCI